MTAHDISKRRTPAVVRTAPVFALVCLLAGITAIAQQAPQQAQTSQTAQVGLQLNDREYFETRGLNVLVFTNEYNGMFFDEKTAGIEIILNGVRLATGGAVRLSPTPEQWDQIPKVVERKVDKTTNSITCVLRYEAFDFDSRLVVTPEGTGFRVAVHVDKPVPEKLEGRAGLNLEFLPSRYFERTYLADGKPGIFPRYPTGPTVTKPGNTKITPVRGLLDLRRPGPERVRRGPARGHGADAGPRSRGSRTPRQHPRRVGRDSSCSTAATSPRTAGSSSDRCCTTKTTGKVAEWVVRPNVIPNWTRTPVIGFSQAGYHPTQKKVAIIELDQNDMALPAASLFEVTARRHAGRTAEGEGPALGPVPPVQVRHGGLQRGEPPGALLHPVRRRRRPRRSRSARTCTTPSGTRPRTSGSRCRWTT